MQLTHHYTASHINLILDKTGELSERFYSKTLINQPLSGSENLESHSPDKYISLK